MGFLLIWLGNGLVPKRRQLVMHAFPDVEDQLVAVLRWMEENTTGSCPVIFLVSGSEVEVRRRLRLLVGKFVDKVRIIKKSNPMAIWCYWRSHYVLFTHGIYGFLPECRRQCVVNLWHGMPLKRIWRGLPNSLVPQCTWLLSTSPKYSEVQAEAAGFPVEKIPATGLPRNDLLFSRTRAALEFGRAARNGVDRVLLFLPTYRQSRTGFITDDGVEMGNTLGMTGDDVTALRNMLAHTGTRILVKPHPMSVHYGRDEKLDDRLWIISDTWLHQQGLTLYEALGQMDALITDVSSVYVDFLILRRPIFFYFPDLVEYRKSRSFQVEPVEDWLAGPLCTTAVQLRDELGAFAAGRDPYREKREKLAGILNPQTGPEATARLFALPGLEIE